MAGEKFVKYKDGKFITDDSGGGGGSSTFAGLDDVSFSNLSNGQVPKYNSTTQKWENSNESGDGQYLPLIYSDEEREVGVWRDGRPLYQKTIDCGYLPNNDVSIVQTGLTNIVAVQGFGYCLSSFQNIFIPNVSASGIQWCIGIHLEDNGATLKIRTGADRSSFYTYITLRYYKTTDTPGSGIWTTQGCYAHHYSTTEHVIGTWIDGKPLYEKTVEIGYLPNSTSTPYPHGISNIKRVVSHSGSAINSSGVYSPLPKVSPSGLQYSADIAITTSDIVITTGSDRSGYYAYVTIQYTKTTDV